MTTRNIKFRLQDLVANTKAPANGIPREVVPVLLTYLSHADGDGKNSWPSTTKVAAHWRMDPKTARTHRDWWIDNGVLVDTGRKQNRVTVYDLAVPAWMETPGARPPIEWAGRGGKTSTTFRAADAPELTPHVVGNSASRSDGTSGEFRPDVVGNSAARSREFCRGVVGSSASTTKGHTKAPTKVQTKGHLDAPEGLSEEDKAEVEALFASWDEETLSTSTSGSSVASVADAPSAPALPSTSSAADLATATAPDANAPVAYVWTPRTDADRKTWAEVESVHGAEFMRTIHNGAQLLDAHRAMTCGVETEPHQSVREAGHIPEHIEAMYGDNRRSRVPVGSRFGRRTPIRSGMPSL